VPSVAAAGLVVLALVAAKAQAQYSCLTSSLPDVRPVNEAPSRKTQPAAGFCGGAAFSDREDGDRRPIAFTAASELRASQSYGPVAGLVGIEGGVVSGVINLESPGV
jgi:hypothetical protein